jgi:hypothetical protein
MKKTFIYGLREINTTTIRYVGKANNLIRRKSEHIRDAKKNKTHKSYWINKVINSGSGIEIIVLEEVNENNWQEREVFWIKLLKENLTNVCEGGIGGKGTSKFILNYHELKDIINNKYPYIKTRKDYINFFKGKNDLTLIPKDPYQYFKKSDEWVSWCDFLSTNNISVNVKSNKFLSYNDTKDWVNKTLPHINTAYDWVEYIKKNELPEFITKKPQRLFNDNKKFSFKDFLNSTSIKKRKNLNNFLKYSDAKTYINDNICIENVKSVSTWLKYHKNSILKDTIPYNAMTYYKKTGEWVSWNDFLSKNK